MEWIDEHPILTTALSVTSIGAAAVVLWPALLPALGIKTVICNAHPIVVALPLVILSFKLISLPSQHL
jgi:hypothetical protein